MASQTSDSTHLALFVRVVHMLIIILTLFILRLVVVGINLIYNHATPCLVFLTSVHSDHTESITDSWCMGGGSNFELGLLNDVSLWHNDSASWFFHVCGRG